MTPKRSSNRDRIDKLRAEVAATDAEKVVKKKAKKKARAASPSRSKAARTAEPVRLKIVWAVVDPKGKIVQSFAYPLKPAAEAEAKRLTTKNGALYKVRPEKVPMEE